MKKFALFLLATALACCSALALAATPEKVTYVFTDPAGSPLVLTDATGAVVSQYRYEPFGEQTVLNAGRTTDTAIGFAGKRLDPSSDLQYSLARYYDRRNGRFVSLDPLGPREGDPHSFNRYAYANNNPYRYLDPDGREVLSAKEGRAKYSKGDGHHWVPFGSLSDLDVSSEARKVFGASTSGISIPHGKDQEGNYIHHHYNDAVKQELKDYAEKQGFELGKMTSTQASDFVRHIKGGGNSEVISSMVGAVNKATAEIAKWSISRRAIAHLLAGMGMYDYAMETISTTNSTCQSIASCAALSQ